MKVLPLEDGSDPLKIGSRIRAIRQERRMTIDQVAESTGLTKGFLSRVERDLTSPSVSSLLSVCQSLGIAMGDLFSPPEVYFSTAETAPQVTLGGNGIAENLLTAPYERRIQVLRAGIEPGGRGERELYTVDCDVEVLHVVQGGIVLRLSNQDYSLKAGDTLTYPGREPHSWENPYSHQAVVIWTLLPAAVGAPVS